MGSAEALYVGLRTADGTKTLNLTDTTKYYWPKADWVPPVGLPTSDGYTDVVETIPLEAIGATGAAVAVNVRALTNLLYQAQRWADGDDVSAVIMDIVMPGSNPAKVLSQIIKGWDGGLFSATYYDEVNTICRARINLNLTRAGVWYHTSYRYPNLGSETDFGGTAPTTTNTGVTASVVAMTGLYGGRAYLQLTKTSGAAANSWINNVPFTVVSGQTYTLKFTHSHTNIASADVQLVRNVPPATGVSGVPVTITLSTNAITAGTTFEATFVPTFTGQVYPYFQLNGPTGATFRIAELMLTSGSNLTELWHPTYTELTTASPTAGTSPDIGNATWRWTHDAYSPVTVTIGRAASQVDYRHPAGFMTFTDKNPFTDFYEMEYGYWNSGVLSAPFALNGEFDAFGGNTVRYTPAGTSEARTPWHAMPYGSVGWKGLLNAFLGIRNNSASTSFTVWVELADAMNIQIGSTPKKVIAANATAPTWYQIGAASIARRRAAAKWRIVVQATAASGTIDFNPILYLRLRPGNKIVQLDSLDLGSGNNWNQIVLDHQLLVDRSAVVAATNVSPAIDSPFSWWTNPTVHMSGKYLYGYMLAMNGSKWRTYLTGGVTEEQWQINATRLPAYPTAE